MGYFWHVHISSCSNIGIINWTVSLRITMHGYVPENDTPSCWSNHDGILSKCYEFIKRSSWVIDWCIYQQAFRWCNIRWSKQYPYPCMDLYFLWLLQTLRYPAYPQNGRSKSNHHSASRIKKLNSKKLKLKGKINHWCSRRRSWLMGSTW